MSLNDKVETEVVGYLEPRYQGEPRSQREIRRLINFPSLKSLKGHFDGES